MRLQVTDFRNYEHAALTLDGRAVVLVGPNGSGKTNLLEAVSCLAPGRGLRRATTDDIARRDAAGAASGPWAVSGSLVFDGVTRRVGVGQDPANAARRLARLDGETVSHAELGRHIRVVWLTPAQDRLFAGPRSERLRYVDRLTLALTPDHGARANAYDRAMRERAKLLEEGGAEAAWLDGLEREMAVHGAALARARADLLVRLQTAVDGRPDGAFPKSDLMFDGVLEQAAAAGGDETALAEDFIARLRAGRRRDAAAGRALEGPHRTDFLARHRAKAMPAGDCSTGEQKALLVGLALAHARALEEAARAAAPILLLDEAVAHLDAARRAGLAEEIAALGAQAWLTGTERVLFDAFEGDAQLFEVDEGRIAEA